MPRNGCEGSVEHFVASVRQKTVVRVAGQDRRDRLERMGRRQSNDRRQRDSTEDASEVSSLVT